MLCRGGREERIEILMPEIMTDGLGNNSIELEDY